MRSATPSVIHGQDLSALETAARAAIAHLESLDSSPVAPSASAETLRGRLAMPLPRAGTPAEQVIAELVDAVAGGILGSAGGRFFAWVIGGALPAALAADWLTAAWDQNAVLYASGPAAAIVEEVTGAWLKQILGLPARAGFAFVSGCQLAHVTCVAAARHALLERRGWNVEQQGLYGAPRIRILAGDQRHGSIERAVRFLGLGASHLQSLPSLASGALAPETLARALEADSSAPAIVLLQAGDIHTGIYDSFAELIPIARRYGAWVHVDGAFGLWAAASPRYRRLVREMDTADSWATDGHKWLNTPFGSGYAFVSDAEALRASMSHREAYLTYSSETRDEIDWNPEWSRRARAFPTYAALRQLGSQGVAQLVDDCCRRAHALVMGIARLPGAELLWEPVINQGLVRFLDGRPDATGEDHDRRTDAVIAAIAATGEAFFGGTTWRGRRAMRVSVCNWRTSDEDIRRTLDCIARLL